MKSLALFACVVLGVAGCHRDRVAAPAGSSPAVQVRLATVQRELVPVQFETSGTVRAVQRATLAGRIGGTIVSPPLALGQEVKAGEVLVVISAPELSARVLQTRALQAQVERELGRERGLFASGSGTSDAVKALEDQLAQVQAAAREAESMLAYTKIRAPFDGFVARKYAEPGDYMSAGSPLAQLDGRNAFELEVGVPDSLASSVGIGAALDVETPATSGRFRAIVTEISSAAEAPARTTTAKLAVPADAPVRPGLFARVFVPGPSVATLLVPAGAVSPFGQMERVFVSGAENRASLRVVKTGGRHRDAIEIVAGLDAGERVVLDPPPTLRDGQLLELVP